MARPRKAIDPAQVEQLAMIDCSYEEMAAVLGCSPDTLQRRFAAVIEKGRAVGRSSLKRTQYRIAMGQNAQFDKAGNKIQKEREPNPTMLIWLGKIRLGQKEPATEGVSADVLEIARAVRDAVRAMREADGRVA